MRIKTWLGIVGGIGLLLLLAGSQRVSAVHSASTSPWDDPAVRVKLDPQLLKQIVAGQASVPVVVEMQTQADLGAVSSANSADANEAMIAALRATADASQSGVRAFLAAEEAAGRASDVRPLWIVNAVGVHASPQTIAQLAARPDVALIREDRYLHWVTLDFQLEPVSLRLQSSVEWGVHRIHADEVWATLGITGTGVVVANMDTGVDFLHPALAGNYRGCVKGLCQHETSWYDATPNGALYPQDGHGHGTHTMGTLVGQGGIGVAPGAKWIAARVLDSSGSGYDTWIHAGFQWILAPGGVSSMAPRLVSNSWGNDLSGDTTFQADVRALRAAGILPIFSNGNGGPAEATVGSPASLPESFAVGATDDTDMVALFSSRGPSPWGEVKPQVVAPGVEVRSAWPGGSYQVLDGTSMAAPHVAGAVALMLSAQPSLTITATAYVLTSTAVPLSTTLPNNESGWGLVDAYAAVMAVAQAGTLSGTVTDASTAAPIAGASVSVTGAHTATTQTDAQGHYVVGMTSGVYNVTAAAFGYEPAMAFNIVISYSTPLQRDFSLTPLPTGTVHGTLTDATGGLPITATVSVVNTPVTQTAFGAYTFTLPAGTYTLRGVQLGYRVITATATITPSRIVTQNLALTRGPKVLLVDSGAWYSKSEIGYFQQALDESAYAYDTWTIRHLPGDVPQAANLLPYDVVIWSSPLDSPGYIGAENAITTYLSSTHSLMISGQDVAFWDGGGSGITYAPYLYNYLKTLYVSDDSGTHQVTGLDADIMAGLTMTIAGPGGADNQTTPDVIAVSDAWSAEQILAYQGDGSAGQKAESCVALKGGGGLRYRGVVLPFGFEAINEASTRRTVMQRVMDYFTGPPRAVGVALSPESETQVGQPGDMVSRTLTVRNLSQVTGDVITLTVSGGAWPTVLSTSQVTLPVCSVVTAYLTVAIPTGAGWNAADVLTVTARSSVSPTLAAVAVLTTKTPAPVLLVDDSRWYDVTGVYTQAFKQAGIAYDLWRIHTNSGTSTFPDVRLGWYPVVVWFTGYNWYDPVDNAEASLDRYLSNGGRLFLTSPFYFYRDTTFSSKRLGVLLFADTFTTSVAYGAANSPIGNGLGTFSLTDPYPGSGFYTLAGAMVPQPDAGTALRGSLDRALAIQRAEANARTVAMSIPFEALTGSDAARAARRIVGWLGWLGDSELEASATKVQPGDSVTITLTARNNGGSPVHSTMTATLPLSVTLVPGSLSPGAAFDPATGNVIWSGILAPSELASVSYRMTLDAALAEGYLTTTAIFRDDIHGIPFDQSAVVRVAWPDLALGTFAVPAQLKSGALLTYTVVVSNAGLAPASAAQMTLLPPMQFVPVSGSVTWAGPGVATATRNLATWQGPLDIGEAVTLTYRLNGGRVLSDALLLSEVLLGDGAGGTSERSVWSSISPYRVYLPVVLRR